MPVLLTSVGKFAHGEPTGRPRPYLREINKVPHFAWDNNSMGFFIILLGVLSAGSGLRFGGPAALFAASVEFDSRVLLLA